MAEVTKSTTASLGSLLLQPADKVSGLLAGEALGAIDACYIKTSDGKVWKATGAAANAAARVRGFSAKAASAGEAVTLIQNCIVGYGTALSPGADYYLSGTVAGGLADAASTGGTAVIAFAVDATRVKLLPAK